MSESGWAAAWPDGGRERDMKAQIRRENGLPRLYVDGKSTEPLLLWLNTSSRALDDMNRDQAAEFGKRGMHLYSCVARLPLSGDDFSECDAAMRCILSGDPDAKILLRVPMSPVGDEAREWGKDHPEDLMVWRVVHKTPYNNGMVNETSIVGTTPCAVTVASDAWFEAAKRAVLNLYRHIDSSEELSDHLLGLHVGGGETGEWFHYGLRERGIDYSAANARKFARWMRAQYGQEAEASLPEDLPGNDRMEPPERTLLVRDTDEKYIAYARYSSWLMSERILDFAHALRTEMGDSRLVVFFYGYLFELYDPRTGHFMLTKVLDSPDIDALTSPISYTDRNEGGVGALMSPADTVTAHGKLWIVENDVRSPNIIRKPLDAGSDWVDKVTSIELYNQILTREAGQMLIHGLGCWYMDLCGFGWHQHPMIWDHISGIHELFKALRPALRPIRPEVAVLVDEEGMFRQGHADWLGVNLLYRTRLSFYRAGVEFGLYTAKDFEDGRVEGAKAAFCLAPFEMTRERADRLRAAAARGHTSLVFLHGFGASDGEAVRALTGMEFAVEESEMCDLSMAGSAICWQDERWGGQEACPAAWVLSGGEELARYTSGPLAGKTAAAIHRGEEYTALFAGATELSPEAVRLLWRLGGAHIYCETDDTFLCGGGIYMLHTSRKKGEKTVRLKEKQRLTAWPSGEEIYTDTLTISESGATGLWIAKEMWDRARERSADT